MNANLYTHALRQKYNNRKKLQRVLNDMFGAGNYGVRVSDNHWVLLLPTELSDSEIEHIESQIRVHYKP
ncbi:hypothetical protein QBC37DRAFT_107583 [Rhypophila decipiens]|uniref:Uncharacterized protein n=1 Tax=Rhypophila decipiens TaxID=261697 RepID=A0AAN7B3H4_9PEZI|nr:hypothetical protein QBC37DRAFT_107583 [Rhypophila decipiens]